MIWRRSGLAAAWLATAVLIGWVFRQGVTAAAAPRLQPPQTWAAAPVAALLKTAVLLGLAGVILLSLYRLHTGWPAGGIAAWWKIPLLALAGLLVAAFWLIGGGEMVTAVCLADTCTPGARPLLLFDALPVSLLLTLTYLLILGGWGLSLTGSPHRGDLAAQIVPLFTSLGTMLAFDTLLFDWWAGVSLCLPCLLSAFLLTLLFWFSLEAFHVLLVGQWMERGG